MHKNYVLNSGCLIELLKGLNWATKENYIKFEFFNEDHVIEYESIVWMHHQIVLYDDGKSINFPIKKSTKSMDRKSFNINHINWIIINDTRFDLKHNICSSKVFAINSNVIENNTKKVTLLKVA